jgi:hypothetical protein
MGDMTRLVHKDGSQRLYATGYSAGTGSHLHPQDNIEERYGTSAKRPAVSARRVRVQLCCCNVKVSRVVDVLRSMRTCESRTAECTYEDGECNSDRRTKQGT